MPAQPGSAGGMPMPLLEKEDFNGAMKYLAARATSARSREVSLEIKNIVSLLNSIITD